MARRASSKMGPRQVQYWKPITPKFTPRNMGFKKGGAGPKKIK